MPSKDLFKDFHNFQQARQTCFRSFYKKYQEKKDTQEALQKALETSKFLYNKLGLTAKYYKGLKGEIIFFGKKYEVLNLDPLVEIGDVHADFRSQITNQYYDVTTNIDYKDISDYIRNDSKESMIAFVDIKSENIELIPTVFEHCPDCGDSLHYVYALSDEFISEALIGFDYPSQDLYKTCSNCDYMEEVSDSLYYMHSPHALLEDIFGSDDENTQEAKELLTKEYTKISNLGRKHFDVFISAVTRPETAIIGNNKHDLYKVDKVKWIHPILDLSKKPDRSVYLQKEFANIYF